MTDGSRPSSSGRSRASLRIGIDARASHFPGIGRHIRELVTHLAEIDALNEYRIYFSSREQLEKLRLERPNFRCVLASSRIYTLKEQLDLPYRLWRDRLDLFHSTTSLDVPLLQPCPLVVTLHDLLLKVLPDHLPGRVAGIYFNVMNSWSIRSAARILTVSQFTADELTSLYPGSRAKVVVAPNGISAMFRPPASPAIVARTRARYGLPEEYILYVGTYKKHKNLPMLVKAFAGLPEETRLASPLVLVGKPDPRFPEVPSLVRELALEGCVLSRDHVEEEDLPALYGGATLFVMPSIYEGFGLPVIEAMACGVPVVCARIPALSEVTGGSAVLVDPNDAADIRTALLRLLKDPELRSSLRKSGLRRAAQFSWRKTAGIVLETYRSVLGIPSDGAS